MLDELVKTIETLQARIRDHSATLRVNETRTRAALIDPLLQVLGWDPADPYLVTPEYQVSAGRADYALLGEDRKPIALIEAKHLDEPLEVSKNKEQVFTYALMQKVKYAGLTDGNLWVLDDLSDFSSPDRRRLSVSIANDPSQQTALQLLLLWRPNLASGQPVAANKPIIPPGPPPPPEGGWTPLADFLPKPKDKFPSAVRLPNTQVKLTRYQRDLLIAIAEYLVRIGKLTHSTGIIESGRSRYICYSKPQHKSGQDFWASHQLSNGLFLETHAPAHQTIAHAKRLLKHFGEDPGLVSLKFN